MKKRISKRIVAGIATFALALSGIVAIGKLADVNAADKLGSEYNGAWAAYVSSNTEALQGADLTGVDSVKVHVCAIDLNYGWNSMQIYTNGAAWVQKSYGASETSSDVTLDATGEFTATVSLTPDSDGWFEIGFGYTAADAFIVEGIEFYAGSTYLGTYADGAFTQRKVESTVLGSEYSAAWASYVDNSSAVFKNFDLSGADSIKIDAIVYNLNYGWNNMQIYTNGDAWAQASYGGSETSSDVKLDATGEFTATVPLTPDSDGYFEIGFGYTSADAFTILSLDFYKGAELLGSLVGNTFYPNATLELSASSTTLKVGEVYTITTTNASTTPVKFTSDDTTVASVNANGVVTALGVGTANIKVTDAFDNVSVIKVKVEAIMPAGITLAAVSTDVKGGDIVNLTATVTPDNATDKTVLWSSSDTAVATVDLNGKVTFANVSGTKTVTITAAAKADASVKATVTFTVEELVIENPVTGVTISDETLVLTKGETADLTATVTPEDATLKTVTWESADETIATVDSDGKVTATGIGTTTVTVKTVDGAKTASCEVTVNAPKATAVSVSVDGEEIDKLDMTVGDTVSLTATAEPDDAVQSFTFATSDESVVTVDEEGVLTAVAAGTATITVTADDVSTEIEVTVTVKKDGSLDVDATGEFKPTIDMSNEEVVSAIKNVLSEEQLAAIEDGTAKVEITLDVTNIDATVSQADKDLIAEAIESISGDYIVMNYLDIKFGANVDGEVISISETDGLITVSVALDKAANGTYKVVRIHDGKADVIDSELSADGTRLTFRTDKFSTYAIIFADVASGDSTPSALIALLVLAAAAVIVTVSVSVKRTAKQR